MAKKQPKMTEAQKKELERRKQLEAQRQELQTRSKYQQKKALKEKKAREEEERRRNTSVFVKTRVSLDSTDVIYKLGVF